MQFRVLLTLAIVALWLPNAGAYCITKPLDTKRCIFKWICSGLIRNITLPPSCQTNPIIDVSFHNVDPGYLNNFSSLPNIKDVIKIDASGNDWFYLPYKLIDSTVNLQKLVLVNNKILSLPSRSFFYLNNLTLIDLSKNNIQQVKPNSFKFHGIKNKLSELYLSNNQLKEITADVFVTLAELKKLDLSYNLIEKLSNNSFRGLVSLEWLKLNNNNMISLNSAIKDLTSLKHLFLRDNHFHSLEISEIPYQGKDLETFDLSKNALSYVHPELFKRELEKNNNVKKPKKYDIILSGNKIMNIENATFNDVILTNEISNFWNATPTQIDLSSNIISEIEFNAFQGVIKLTDLDLSSNKLTSFNVNMNNMNYLERLDLRNNLIHYILSESFSRLHRLRFADFTNNKIKSLPKHTFNNLIYVYYLNMSNNDITMINRESLGDLSFLDTLDLSSNNLNSVELSQLRSPKLKNLILRWNKITSMTSVQLDNLLNLKYLDISLNRITDLNQNSLTNLRSLIRLNFESNKISQIQPSSFLNQISLATLILRNNDLKNLDYGTFNGLQNLIELDLSYNKIANLDSKVFYELKSLKVLKLDRNEIYAMNLEIFRARPGVVEVSVGGNHLPCEWLSSTMNEAKHAWLNINLTAMHRVTAKTNVDGIQCEGEKSEKIIDARDTCHGSCNKGNEELLITNMEILKAIRKQTSSLNKDLKVIEKLLQVSNRISYQEKNKNKIIK